MNYQKRNIQKSVTESLHHFPVVAILGPRQCGKSTLAKHLLDGMKNALYLDLEKPSDLAKLEDAELFLSSCRGRCVCLDEIQRKPEIFTVIRSLVDAWGGNGHFLVLGSASRDLLNQSSESLAGRIAYKRLTPFLYEEISRAAKPERYFTRGGFPRSLMAASDAVSLEWRENFITTFLERDLLLWHGFTPTTMRRLWLMLAHVNGQTVNYARLAGSLGVSDTTVRRYIDLLSETYMTEVIPPYFSNLGKRMVRAPKVYLSDNGITAALLRLPDFTALCGHPVFGSIWEQIVLANLKGMYPDAQFAFYRTSQGSEMDFVMDIRGKTIAVECKATSAPSLQKGNYLAAEDIHPTHTIVAAPVEKGWPLAKGFTVANLSELRNTIDFFV
ncbi:MAG: ATP-binding protein [Kiritimatiellae bacterium]|nr:ATP-binding protein [Kiritimatiellia bacterium]